MHVWETWVLYVILSGLLELYVRGGARFSTATGATGCGIGREWITALRWTSARIATALFSHKVRSHSSEALCARVSVCGGALRAAVVPNARRKGLSGGVGDERC